MLFADLHDLGKLCRGSVQMNHDHGFRMRVLFKGLLKCFRAHIPGIRLRVNKHRRGILVNNRVTGCTERKRRGKYHISRPHSQDAQRQVDSRSTCAERSGMGNAHISCQFLFKLINIRPKRRNPVGVKSLLDKLLLLSMHGGRG